MHVIGRAAGVHTLETLAFELLRASRDAWGLCMPALRVLPAGSVQVFVPEQPSCTQQSMPEAPEAASSCSLSVRECRSRATALAVQQLQHTPFG